MLYLGSLIRELGVPLACQDFAGDQLAFWVCKCPELIACELWGVLEVIYPRPPLVLFCLGG
jgi:hypothetical protein